MIEISCHFCTAAQLKAHYMPFLPHGGLFFISDTQVQLGDRITARVRLPKEDTQITFGADVVWINPNNAQDARPRGFGVAFNASHINLKTQIEVLISDVTVASHSIITM